ncbi:MAG: DUF4363 family protein [Clostridiales bacterium]|jgi:predicted RNA-binding protein with EMAP domain|nr:DUF4363 family protein [Bacillota bacterium]NLK04332.1 DUF4363 family protein [Clostridiales bacterium]
MRRFLIYLIPIVAMLIFLLIMISGDFLKKPFSTDDDIAESISDLIEAVNNEAWEEADNKIIGLELAWKKVLFRVQFSSERGEINELTTSIARLKGAIMAKDKPGALMELYEAYSHWNDLGS